MFPPVSCPRPTVPCPGETGAVPGRFREPGKLASSLFPNAHKHTKYAIDAKDGERCLKAESDGSASALVYKGEFNVYEFPTVKWRWKVDNVYQKGDPEKKSGDDYPIRIQIVFKYEPEKAGRVQRIEYGLVKKMYGEYPPQSTLSYVWASREDQKAIIAAPFQIASG